jgi:hemerythrin-like metal-binding protein
MYPQMNGKTTLLGVSAMDDSHDRLLGEVAAIGVVRDQEFAAWYPALVAALERDFREEELLMESVGLIAFQQHLEQHARMLSALHHAAPRVAAGDINTGRETVSLLRQWLQFHIAVMDRALADAVLQKMAP